MTYATDRRIVLILDKIAQAAPALGRDRVVGIHPEQPVAGRVAQRFIAGGREIIAPWEVKELGAERLDDPWRLIDRAGVDDDHLVNPRPDALEAGDRIVRALSRTIMQSESLRAGKVEAQAEAALGGDIDGEWARLEPRARLCGNVCPGHPARGRVRSRRSDSPLTKGGLGGVPFLGSVSNSDPRSPPSKGGNGRGQESGRAGIAPTPLPDHFS